jgi:hypothetical protein
MTVIMKLLVTCVYRRFHIPEPWVQKGRSISISFVDRVVTFTGNTYERR